MKPNAVQNTMALFPSFIMKPAVLWTGTKQFRKLSSQKSGAKLPNLVLQTCVKILETDIQQKGQKKRCFRY